MKDDRAYIKIILESIKKIEAFTLGASEGDFLNNQMMQSAVIFQLALIGEEANKISSETKASIPLSWREIVGFRNAAIHNYMSLNLNIVWNTIKEDTPNLKNELVKADLNAAD